MVMTERKREGGERETSNCPFAEMLCLNCLLSKDLMIINPRRACTRVTVVVLCVCLSVIRQLTFTVIVRAKNELTYPAADIGKNLCGIFSENASLQS